jgi:hypothetical protein
MTYAIFSRTGRVQHAAHKGSTSTVCGLPIGAGSGLVRDGNYHGCQPCARCWTAALPTVAPTVAPRVHEPQGEAVRLFTPAPPTMPGQLQL